MFLPCVNKIDDDDEISQKTSVISICLAVGDIQFKVSKMRRGKVRPPYTTRQAQCSLPDSHCSWVFVARRLVWKQQRTAWRSVNLSCSRVMVLEMVSSWTPGKTGRWVLGTNFCLLILNHKSWRSVTRILYARSQSARVAPTTRKSSRYTTMLGKPLLAIMRRTAWVMRWKISGELLAPNGRRVS